jgi:hypothetical protein
MSEVKNVRVNKTGRYGAKGTDKTDPEGTTLTTRQTPANLRKAVSEFMSEDSPEMTVALETLDAKWVEQFLTAFGKFLTRKKTKKLKG